jgi:hypothetical protein
MTFLDSLCHFVTQQLSWWKVYAQNFVPRLDYVNATKLFRFTGRIFSSISAGVLGLKTNAVLMLYTFIVRFIHY